VAKPPDAQEPIHNSFLPSVEVLRALLHNLGVMQVTVPAIQGTRAVCLVPWVTLNTLKLALYDDLATDKDGHLTGKPEKSERAFLKVMHRCQKPIALFIDDGHDLHGQTLRSLKQFMEETRRRGGRLTLVLAGHPRLKWDSKPCWTSTFLPMATGSASAWAGYW